MSNICQKYVKNMSNISKIIYIYLYFYGCIWIFRTSTSRLALASSGRDLDAAKRAWEVPTPKKRMLGPTPMSVFRVEPHKTCENGCLLRPPEYFHVCVVGAKDDEDKK